MTKSRNYNTEYEHYQGTTVQKKRRAMRNKARRMMMRDGKVHKNDGMDVAHMDNMPMHNAKGNLRVQTKKQNRSFPRTKTARRKKK